MLFIESFDSGISGVGVASIVVSFSKQETTAKDGAIVATDIPMANNNFFIFLFYFLFYILYKSMFINYINKIIE